MYGAWFGTVSIGILALIALIALFVAASPLFAVLFVLLVVAFLASLVVFRRGQQAAAGGSRSGGGPSGANAAAGGGAAGRARNPRSGGEPVSGEGHATAGETAGQRASSRH
jgi:hypothetical protein